MCYSRRRKTRKKMIDLSGARELVPFWTPLIFLVLFVVISGAVLWIFKDERESAHSDASYFFKRMGLSLLFTVLFSGFALGAETAVWDSTANIHKVLKSEVQRVYGIGFDSDSTFDLYTAGVGTDADGNQVIVRYNRETNELETVAAWEPLDAK